MAAPITKTVVHKDFDITFKAHPITGKLIVRKNAESIKQAVKNLILTNFYERPYRPRLGSGVRGLLFDLYDPALEQNLKYSIRTALENFEPRAELLDIRLVGDSDRNSLNVTIIFRPVNSTAPVETTISLERTR
jgi:phage baseplate assembly protein W